MKFICLSLLIFSSNQNDFSKNIKSNNLESWDFYKQYFNLTFSVFDELKRKEIFEKNLKLINDFNRKNQDVKLEVNRFAHLEKHEIQFPRKEILLSQEDKKPIAASNIHLKQSVDWRRFKVVSPVEDQGYCAACYVFSSLGSMESSFALKTGYLNQLSKQQVLDCSTLWGNKGCCGGKLRGVFSYAKDNGITTQNNYPYEEKNDKCRLDPTDQANGYRLLGYRSVKKNDEMSLVRAISFFGPVAIGFNNDPIEFTFYKTGILNITNCDSKKLTHGALAVGYELGHKPYLLVKNSYGTDWGEEGYFRIALFQNNQCGIASDAAYPIPRLTGTISFR